MNNFISKLDNFATTLWLETAGLMVAMSLVFVAVIELF